MPENLVDIDLQLEGANEALALFGTNDKHLKQLEALLDVDIISRGESIRVSGENPGSAVSTGDSADYFKRYPERTDSFGTGCCLCCRLGEKGKIKQFETLFEDEITKNYKGKSIRVKTLGQKQYVQAIKSKDLVFGIGPAGTGKTYLAVVMAVHAMKNGLVKKLF